MKILSKTHIQVEVLLTTEKFIVDAKEVAVIRWPDIRWPEKEICYFLLNNVKYPISSDECVAVRNYRDAIKEGMIEIETLREPYKNPHFQYYYISEISNVGKKCISDTTNASKINDYYFVQIGGEVFEISVYEYERIKNLVYEEPQISAISEPEIEPEPVINAIMELE